MQHVKQAVGGMLTVGGLPDVTPAQVGESRTTYISALGDLLPFKRILNVHLSRWFAKFGQKVRPESTKTESL